MPFTLVVTQLGRQAIVDAGHTGTLPVTIAQAGLSASVITPVETALILPAEIKRVAAVGGDVVAPDTLHVSVLDESADVYTAYSIALYLGDGTLFAIGGGTDPLFNKAAGSMAAVSLDIVLTDIAATSVTFGDTSFTEAPATTERQGVVELATVTEAQAGIDALRALTPGSAKAAVLGWLLAQDGSGSGLDADLLDGQNGSWYADVVGRLGYTPMRAQAGEVSMFATSGAPTGWLKCDGSAVSRATYAGLFAVIGTLWGAGDGSTTFNLPDLRGEFVRGWDDGRGVDPGRTIGSAQGDAIKSHNHFAFAAGQSSIYASEVTPTAPAYSKTDNGNSGSAYIGGAPGATPSIGPTSSAGGAESRPRNVALLYCIKT